MLLRLEFLRLAIGDDSRSDDLEKGLTHVYYKTDITVVLALDPVLFLGQDVYHGISLPSFPLVPHQIDNAVELPEHGLNRESIAFVFSIDLKATINSISVGSTQRACVTDHRGSRSMVSNLSLSDFALKRVPTNRANLPRTCLGFCNILLSSSRMYCEVTFRAPSMFTELMR